MVLNNRINKKKSAGFTLVELLIVIVVIAILAAITIVAYSGITARAYTSKSQTAAESAQKVAEAMNADNGFYPALAITGTVACTATTPAATNSTCFTLGSTSTKLPSGMNVIPDVASTGTASTVMTSGTVGNNGTTVAYACTGAGPNCTSATGGKIAYWNYATSSVNYVYVGSATSSSTFYPPSN